MEISQTYECKSEFTARQIVTKSSISLPSHRLVAWAHHAAQERQMLKTFSFRTRARKSTIHDTVVLYHPLPSTPAQKVQNLDDPLLTLPSMPIRNPITIRPIHRFTNAPASLHTIHALIKSSLYLCARILRHCLNNKQHPALVTQLRPRGTPLRPRRLSL